MTKQNVAELATVLSMTDEECAEWDRLNKEFRKVLRSALVKPAKAAAHAA